MDLVRVPAVSAEERAGYASDLPVLPGDEDKRIPIAGLFESGSQLVDIRLSEAHIDRQVEDYRSRLNGREGTDIRVRDSVSLHLLPRIGSKYRVRCTERFRNDRR